MTPNKKHFIETREGPWETWCSENDIQVHAVWKEFELFIYFQGSSSVKDWLVNFNYPIKPYRNMKDGIWLAHGGFVKAYKNIRSKVIELAEKADKIYISGYSQGGAYALLAHEDLSFYDMSVETITYAAPKVFWWFGFWNLKKRMKNLTLVQNRGDIVTKLPFIFMGFLHIGKKIKLGKVVHDILPLPKFHYSERYLKNLPQGD